MGWVFLLIGGALECFGALAMKKSEGFSQLWPSLLAILLLGTSLLMVSLAMRTIPMGTAYAVWAGIGIASIAISGILFLNEPASLLRLGAILCIVVGVVGLKLVEAIET